MACHLENDILLKGIVHRVAYMTFSLVTAYTNNKITLVRYSYSTLVSDGSKSDFTKRYHSIFCIKGVAANSILSEVIILSYPVYDFTRLSLQLRFHYKSRLALAHTLYRHSAALATRAQLLNQVRVKHTH